MTSKNIRIYEIEASGKPQKLIKILSAEKPGNYEEAINIAHKWIKYGMSGDVVKVINYEDNSPVKLIKAFMKK